MSRGTRPPFSVLTHGLEYPRVEVVGPQFPLVVRGEVVRGRAREGSAPTISGSLQLDPQPDVRAFGGPSQLGFRAYPTRYSVKQGETLEICIANVGATAKQIASWQVIRVRDFAKPLTWRDPTADFTYPPQQTDPPNPLGIDPALLPGPYAEELGYGWSPSFSWRVPISPAALGLHAVIFDAQGVGRAIVYFLVRPPGPTQNKILFCWPWSTAAAYAGDAKADTFTSVYESIDPGRLRRVSLDRPFDAFVFGGKETYVYDAPLRLWQFLRGEKFEMDPITSFDLHDEWAALFPPQNLSYVGGGLTHSYQLFISVGHDEYWSREMRDAIRAFVKAGGNAAFFSANVAWWQVRFEGEGNRIMACYKSAIDDPLTGKNDGLVTGIPSGWPTDDPENLMTGASYRRGTQGVVSQYQLVRNDPLVNGASFAFPTTGNLSTLETDAVELDANFKPTGRDGSPLNFTALAVASRMDADESMNQRGHATLGYFTDHGRVFTAGTTDWALNLTKADGSGGDTSVQTITRNVVTAFSSYFPGPAATFPTRPPPTASWKLVDWAQGAVHLVAIVQGDLFMHEDARDTLRRTNAEDPVEGWRNTTLDAFTAKSAPASSGVASAYTSDVWGKRIYAGDAKGPKSVWRLRTPNPDASVSPPWDPVPNAPAGACTAVGWAGTVLFAAITPTGKPTSLFAEGPFNPGVVTDDPWRNLGRTQPAMLHLAGTDGKLFGLGSDNTLYCRESTPVDLVWSPIASGPSGTTHSLAGYYGRLYAITTPATTRFVTSQRGLYWRSATSNRGTITPHMLFLRNASGNVEYAVGQLEGSGYFRTTGGGAIQNLAFDDAVRIAPDLVLFRSDQGVWSVYRFTAEGIASKVTSGQQAAGAWDAALTVLKANSAQRERVFVYIGWKGSGQTLEWDPNQGALKAGITVTGFRKDWSIVTTSWSGKLVFYHGATGRIEWGSLDSQGYFVGEGSDVLPPPKYVAKNLGELPGWLSAAPSGNEYVVFFHPVDGELCLVRFDGPSLDVVIQPVTVPNSLLAQRTVQNQKAWRRIWSSALGLVLLYERETGAADPVGFWDPRDPQRPSGFDLLRNATFHPGVRPYGEGTFDFGWETVIALGTLK